MTETLGGTILNALCRHRRYFLVFVGLLGGVLLMTGVGFLVIAPGTPAYTINVLNAVGLSVFLLVFGGLTVYCYRTDRRYA